MICVIQITSDIRRAICFNALLIIDILPLVAIRETPMGTLTYSMRASLECLQNVARNGIVSFMKCCTPRVTPLGPNYLFNFQCFFNLSISSLYILDFIISLSLDNDVLETSKRRAMFCNILSQIFYCQMFYQIFTYSN